VDSFVAVGRLMRTHGLFGDILCKPLTHNFERHSSLKKVYLEFSNGGIKDAIICHSETYGNLWKFRFDGFNSPEAVQPFVNAYILIPESERLPLPEGEFYFSDFEDFEAIDKDGNLVGKVLNAEEMPSVNVFNMLINEREIVAPWIDDCILNVDMKNKKITVNLEFIKSLT
jgi:16S rRNA processing protein RimM